MLRTFVGFPNERARSTRRGLRSHPVMHKGVKLPTFSDSPNERGEVLTR